MRNGHRVPRRLVRRGWPPVLAVVVAVLLAALQPRCGSQYALLLTLSAKAVVRTLDVKVKDLATGEIVLQQIGQEVDPNNYSRDISKPGQELKLAIEFAAAGNYLVYILGRSGGGSGDRQYALKDYQIDGVREESLMLVPLPEDQDKDQDNFPTCPAGGCGGKDTPSVACRFLDCADDDSICNPKNESGKEGCAKSINPMAPERCANGLDDDCSAGCGARDIKEGDAECVDNDGDGVNKGEDCDDNDPCRSPKILEAANLCSTPKESQAWGLPAACKKELAVPRCGDGIDQDCSGADVACIVDNDCDQFPKDADCNDNDPKINPKAPELCDGKDNNCNGTIDEGCVPCDVDGDNHALTGTTDLACKDKPQDDSDDYDAGVNPDTTKDSNGQEGGTVQGALRGFCSSDTAKDKDGRRPRDVDHDGDNKPAKEDGCPAESCDTDGDGFAAASCSPPKALEDCNDSDATIFPGAPDKCGDGIAQNCASDSPCTCDKDGDGYCPPADCDDGNPNVHPWATELCDAVDNDCDGLVNEGNPDPAGKLIPTNVSTCNDDNDGMCACPAGTTPPCTGAKIALSGKCGCTKSKPTPDNRDKGGNRMKCPGEDNWDTAAAPRCFLAMPPQTERCLDGDFNCDGHNTAPGEPFDIKGMICGTDTGNCKTGKVVDCDLGKTYQHLALAQAIDKTFVDFPHIVCDGQLPFPEVCNGKNDSCTSNTPPSLAPYFDRDTDGDGFLPCQGCTTNDPDPRRNLAAGLTGCADCNDLAPSTHPGAAEMCNGIDDNCAGGLTDDGKDQCGGPGGYPDRCCSGVCRNVATSFNYCGSCTTGCDPKNTDACVGGKCTCGSKGAACDPGQDCKTNSCVCIANGLCTGCCNGNTCVFTQTTGQCGRNGAACKDCNDGNVCTSDSCNSGTGQCVNSPLGPTTGCTDGKCRNGNCCTGCWDGDSCEAGTTPAVCGDQGDACQNCPIVDCKTRTCNSGVCGQTNQPDGSSCASSTGTCNSGNCCTNCWSGSTCMPGTAVAACGDNGAACQSCTAPTCFSPTCVGQTCGTTPNNGAPCTGGTCLGGGCCTGCIAGTNCAGGTGTDDNATCGTGGITCVNCTSTGKTCDTSGNCICNGCMSGTNCVAGNQVGACGTGGGTCLVCTAGVCKDPTCSGGVCGTTNESDGSSCTGGKCYDGSCCTSCWDGNSCEAGNTVSVCGDNGDNCVACTTTQQCKDPACNSGACGTTDKVDGASCTGGVCYNGSCCTGCWSGTSCLAGDTDTACGTGGENCKNCAGMTPAKTCNASHNCT